MTPRAMLLEVTVSRKKTLEKTSMPIRAELLEPEASFHRAPANREVLGLRCAASPESGEY